MRTKDDLEITLDKLKSSHRLCETKREKNISIKRIQFINNCIMILRLGLSGSALSRMKDKNDLIIKKSKEYIAHNNLKFTKNIKDAEKKMGQRKAEMQNEYIRYIID